MTYTRIVDAGLYTSRALAEAREAYAHYCQVRAASGERGRVTVTLEVKPEYETDGREIVLEFWNYYLDASCKKTLEAGAE